MSKRVGKLQVFAFLLEQDLSGLPVEFALSPKWRKSLVSLDDLEALLPLRFDPKLHAADQNKTPAGDEVKKLLESNTAPFIASDGRTQTPVTMPQRSI